MKKLLIYLLLVGILTSFTDKGKVFFYIGTTNKSDQSVIALAELDLSTGNVRLVDSAVVSPAPSYLAIGPGKKTLYAVTLDNQIRAFGIEPNKKLRFLNSVSSEGANPCHVSVHPSGKKVFAANYSGGTFAAYDLLPSGSIGEISYTEQYSGSGPNQRRQNKAYAHCAVNSPNGKYVYVADLGTDRVMNYQVVGKGDKIVPNPSQAYLTIKPGSGPRQMSFHSNGKYVYLLNELSADLTAIAVSAQGVLEEIETYPTIPADFQGANSAAAVHLHPNGKFVLVSNRGHNSISVFRILSNGKLQQVDVQTQNIDTPRDFNIDPTGRFVVVGNQMTSDLTVFAIDPATGKLTFRVAGIKVANPTAIAFL
jgi:6-phosphogluconolactonase